MRVVRAGGLATLQDLGWRGYRALGLPPGGAADRAALRIANALAGADPEGAAIEIALGEIEVEFEDDRTFAATGAVGLLRLDGGDIEPGTSARARRGQRLRVTPDHAGRFAYLAVAGGITSPATLGSRATYLPAALGGWQGRRLAAGDQLPLGAARPPGGPDPGEAARPGGPIRITTGPQEHLFDAGAFEQLATADYRLSPVSDRMGSRLLGPPITARRAATLPSESTAVGAIQIPDDGQPIVILPDGPTVGGYHKIGVVASADLGRFSQTPLGAPVRFQWISIAEAQRAAREALTATARRIAAIRASAPA